MSPRSNDSSHVSMTPQMVPFYHDTVSNFLHLQMGDKKLQTSYLADKSVLHLGISAGDSGNIFWQFSSYQLPCHDVENAQ